MDNQFNMYFRGQGLTDLPKNKRRNVTVSGVIKENTLNFGMAVCNPKDQFVKEKDEFLQQVKQTAIILLYKLLFLMELVKKKLVPFLLKLQKNFIILF